MIEFFSTISVIRSTLSFALGSSPRETLSLLMQKKDNNYFSVTFWLQTESFRSNGTQTNLENPDHFEVVNLFHFRILLIKDSHLRWQLFISMSRFLDTFFSAEKH